MNTTSNGKVYWFTGLAGAGKTTIGKEFYSRLSYSVPKALFLDGDDLREIFGVGHSNFTVEDRRSLAMQYAKLCRYLALQGFHVVCATISMFHEVRQWNRDNIQNYQEVFIRVPVPVLLERDQKKLYSRAIKNQVKDVIGIDIPAEEPRNPDVVIDNDGSMDINDIVDELWISLQSGKKG